MKKFNALFLTFLLTISCFSNLVPAVGYDTQSTTYQYFAEGYTGPGFEEYLCLQNPNLGSVDVEVMFMFRGGGTITKYYTISSLNRHTVFVNDVVGSNKEVSIRVKCNQPIVAERPMYFNYKGKWAGGHSTVGALSPSETWYFAEGYTGLGFEEWLCIQNPNPIPSNIVITYMFRGGGTKVQNLTIGPNTRETISVNEVVGENREVSVKLESNQPIVAERPMYFNYMGQIDGGHSTIGTTSPSKKLFFAEGYTGLGFHEWLTIQNSNPFSTLVTIKYSYRDGRGTVQHLSIGPNARETINVNSVVGPDKEVSVEITSTEPIVAERPMYFYTHGGITGGHNVIGTSNAALEWFFAEGYTGEGFYEWLTILNPNPYPVEVWVTYVSRDQNKKGRFYTIGPNTRETISVNDAIGAAEHSLQVRCDSPIVAERPMYFNYQGKWTGGHDVLGATFPFSIPIHPPTPNNSPYAHTQFPIDINEGTKVSFDANKSHDTDGSIVNYEWEFNGDDKYDDASGVEIAWTFEDDFSGAIGLKVTDNDGATNIASAGLTVYNVVPQAQATNNGPRNEGVSVTVTASQTDPGTLDTFTYSFDWENDGTYEITDQSSPQASHIYNDNDTYTVKVKVKDDDGGEDTATTNVIINDLSPQASLTGDISLEQDQQGSYDASGSVSSPDAIVSYEWDFDYDGITFNPSGDTGSTQTHSWTTPGNYTVAVRVTDDDNSTDIATLDVGVTFVPEGGNLIYTVNPSGVENDYLGIIGSDSSDNQVLIDGAGWFSYSLWSPTGDKFLGYWRVDSDYYSQVLSPTGEVLKDLGIIMREPIWTQNGNSIDYGIYTSGIYRYNLVNDEITQIIQTAGFTFNHCPAWSSELPDETKFAFVHHEFGSSYYVMLIDNFDWQKAPYMGEVHNIGMLNPELQLVKEGNSTYDESIKLQFTPNEEKLVFSVRGENKIYVVDLTTSPFTVLEIDPFIGAGLRGEALLSHSGDKIAYRISDGTYVVDIDGTNIRKVSSYSGEHVWSPNDTQLAIADWSRLHIVDAESGYSQLVDDFQDGYIYNLDWSTKQDFSKKEIVR